MQRNIISVNRNKKSGILLDRGFTDILRFVACCMVALGHYAGYSIAELGVHNFICDIAVALFGYLGVALFFFLSGYGLMMSFQRRHVSFKDFVTRRLSKTWLPAVLASGIWLVINLLMFGTGGGNLLCNQKYLLGVIWLFNDEVMWFVQTIIVLYLFFYLYVWLSSRCTSKASFYVLIGVAACSTLIVRPLHLGDPISVPLFFVGITVAKWPEQVKKLMHSWQAVVLIVLVASIVAYVCRSDNRVLHGVINYLAMFFFLEIVMHYNISVPSVPKWVGGCSYDIYLVHYKTHLMLACLFAVDQLWMFMAGTALATVCFYNLRKAIHL